MAAIVFSFCLELLGCWILSFYLNPREKTMTPNNRTPRGADLGDYRRKSRVRARSGSHVAPCTFEAILRASPSLILEFWKIFIHTRMHILEDSVIEYYEYIQSTDDNEPGITFSLRHFPGYENETRYPYPSYVIMYVSQSQSNVFSTVPAIITYPLEV